MIGEITMVPVGADASSMRKFVDSAVEAIRDTGVRCQVTAMGTDVEGDFDEILRAFRAAHDACVRDGAPRVMAFLRVDDRLDKVEHLEPPPRAIEKETEVEEMGVPV